MIIDSKDLDAQMGRHIDPNSVPRHDGGDIGHMQAVIQRGSEQIIVEQGGGKFGAAVLHEQEVGKQDFYGSQTIISVNDAPPIPEQMDPLKKMPMPKMPPLAAPPVAAATPALRPVAPVAAPGAKKVMTTAELLKSMGLAK
jgi:hypothetical protein